MFIYYDRRRISWDDNADDKIEGNRIKFLEDLKQNKIKSEKYSKDMVKRLPGHEVTVSHMQKEGFNNPIFVPEKDGLGMNGLGFFILMIGILRKVLLFI